jgi:glycosyltransferase involved in cell wall biosynthesis
MIALITPTGGRKAQIHMLSMFMQNQDYNKQVLWVIVDDCTPETTQFIDDKGFKPKWMVIRLYPELHWERGQNTQARNLLAGIAEAEKYDIEAVFIIEDDDYYPPNYLLEMMKRLEGFELAGETKTVYYNVKRLGWSRFNNVKHASLFQIAMKLSVLPLFKKICLQHKKLIDIKLCKQVKNKNLFKAEPMAIGIKGLKGRAGIGIGHSDSRALFEDSSREKLKKLLGKDSEYYI